MTDVRNARQATRVAIRTPGDVRLYRQSVRVATNDVIPASGVPVKVWSGSAWVDPTAVRIWTGSAWVDAAVKTWNGSAWI